MDTTTALTRFEAALNSQVTLAGADPAVESAAQALLTGLAPAAHQLALELAEQAAAEVAAQLRDHQVDVVVREGEPALAIRAIRGNQEVPSEDFEARISLRLPPTLKSQVEEAANAAGDSVNTWLVKSLARVAATASSARPGRQFKGTVQT